ncbi:MAG: hypothetical protein ACE5OZ_03035 [Candidatus Heimdallarchaeota archaeon]
MLPREVMDKNDQLSFFFFLSAVWLWLFALASSSTDIGKFGLITVLPPTYFLAATLLIAAFLLKLKNHDPGNERLPAVYTLFLIFFLILTPPLIEGTPRLLRGFAMYEGVSQLLYHQEFDPAYYDYHRWPGLFLLISELALLVGFEDPTFFLLLYPTAIWLAYSLPLYNALRLLLDRSRLVWVALWLFYLGLWIDQEYFSPQSLGFFFFLLGCWFILVIANKTAFYRHKIIFGVLLAFVALCTFLVHLLSFTALALCVFSIIGSKAVKVRTASLRFTKLRISLLKTSSSFFLVIFVVLITVLTIFYLFEALGIQELLLGDTYWGERFRMEFLQPDKATTEAVETHLAAGSSEHSTLVSIRILFVGIIAAMTLGGLIVSLRTAQQGARAIQLIFWIFGLSSLLLVMSYGTEMILRVFMFSLLPLSALMAHLFDSKYLRSLLILFFLLAVPFHITSHYGNEYMDYVPASELRGIDFLYSHAISNASVYEPSLERWFSFRPFNHVDYQIGGSGIYYIIKQTSQRDHEFYLTANEHWNKWKTFAERDSNLNMVYANPSFWVYVRS